eukprot:382666_1
MQPKQYKYDNVPKEVEEEIVLSYSSTIPPKSYISYFICGLNTVLCILALLFFISYQANYIHFGLGNSNPAAQSGDVQHHLTIHSAVNSHGVPAGLYPNFVFNQSNHSKHDALSVLKDIR